MSILTTVRDRYTSRNSSGVKSTDAQGDPGGEARLPFAGYDRLDAREVIDGLSDHSQVDLETIESYERSHKTRDPVLDKLRYMRGCEPMPSYDALSVEEILVALEDTDLDTIRRVRGYERKFANRAAVLDEVVRVHHLRLAEQPPSAPPAYQPTSATTDASARSERVESGRP